MKKQYISPLVEAMPILASRQLMETSIQLPPDMAPKRRVPALGNDSVTVF